MSPGLKLLRCRQTQLQSESLGEMEQPIAREPGQCGCFFLKTLALSAAEQKPVRE